MKVCKFGGSSVSDANQIRKVCNIILADPTRQIVVVSAPGKRSKEDTKITDMLMHCAEARLAEGDWESLLAPVVERYTDICRDLELDPAVATAITNALHDTVAGSIEHVGRYQDAVKAAGEDNSARLIAGALRKAGCSARYLNPGEAGLLVSDEYGHARLLPQSLENLAELAYTKDIVVFPGFFGYTPGGEIVTFSRGGSDITGAILAAATNAMLYENFTDVDAVYVADPRVIHNPLAVRELTYREMRELSYAGFGVLHDEAIIPAVRAGIPICIKNTNAPDAPGTMIVPEHQVIDSRVVGIAASGGFCTVFISKYLMNREIGFGRHLLQIFEEEGVSYEHTPSGIDNISIIIDEAGFPTATEEVVCRRIKEELEPDNISVEHGMALIMIVGEGMRYAVGVASGATRALAEAGVNVEMLNQGSSEISMMFGVSDEDALPALRALYREFFENPANLTD
ncbi:MAG: aspartate kinase [Kiritimatiellia bacterium]